MRDPKCNLAEQCVNKVRLIINDDDDHQIFGDNANV